MQALVQFVIDDKLISASQFIDMLIRLVGEPLSEGFYICCTTLLKITGNLASFQHMKAGYCREHRI